MGDKKHKKEHKDKKRKATSTDSDSDDRKKHKHKEKKHKKEKEKKRDGDAEQEKRRIKEAKKFLKQRLKQDSGAQPSDAAAKVDNSLPPADYKVTPISEDDYFAKNPEFSTWLRDSEGVAFNELGAEDARERFTGFVAAWNERKLPLRLYTGVDGGALRRTQHAWGIRGSGGSGVVRGMVAAMEEEREAAEAERAGRQVERRKWKAEQNELLDEMLPRATAGTREARVEAKAARREEARARGASPDVVHLPGGGDAMGLGDGDSFQAAQARQAAAAARRGKFGAIKAEANAQKLAEFTAKEDERMAMFKALVQQGPITIQKR